MARYTVVTGGAGFIGSCFVWKLNQLGLDHLMIVDRLGGEEKWQNLVHKRFAEYLDKDDFIARLRAGRLDDAIEQIVHIGACSATTERDAEYLMRNNTQYSIDLAQWCLAHGRKLWYASSAATYGDGECGYGDDPAALPRLRPMNMYGFSKHLFDLWVVRQGQVPALTGFKYFNVFGPNEYHKGGMRSVIHKAFPLARDEGKVRLFKSYRAEYPDGGQRRDFVYVKDVVEMMAYFFERPALGGIYNIGTGCARSWNDVAAAIFAAVGRRGTVEYVEMPAELRGKYQYFTEADVTNLRAVGCTHTCMTLEASVADYLRKHLLQPDPYL